MYHDKSPHAYRTHIYTRMHMHPQSYPYRTYAHIHPHARATAHAFRIRRPRTPPHPHLHLHPKKSIHPFVCPPDPPPTFGLSICPPIPHPNQSYARYLFDAGAPSRRRGRARRRPSRAVLHRGHDVRGARGPVRSGPARDHVRHALGRNHADGSDPTAIRLQNVNANAALQDWNNLDPEGEEDFLRSFGDDAEVKCH